MNGVVERVGRSGVLWGVLWSRLRMMAGETGIWRFDWGLMGRVEVRRGKYHGMRWPSIIMWYSRARF